MRPAQNQPQKMSLASKLSRSFYDLASNERLTKWKSKLSGGGGNKKDKLEITWDTAYAADAPLSHYEVFNGNKKVASVKHQPQITKQPFTFNDRLGEGDYRVVTVDKAGNRAESESFSFS